MKCFRIAVFVLLVKGKTERNFVMARSPDYRELGQRIKTRQFLKWINRLRDASL